MKLWLVMSGRNLWGPAMVAGLAMLAACGDGGGNQFDNPVEHRGYGGFQHCGFFGRFRQLCRRHQPDHADPQRRGGGQGAAGSGPGGSGAVGQFQPVIRESEGAKFWLNVFTKLNNRGLKDCFIACVGGLKGLPEAIETVFAATQVQLSIVHKVRDSLKYVPWKERKAVARDLRTIYAAPSLEAAEAALEAFYERWDAMYPAISASWRADWTRRTVCFDFPPEIRQVIYTTNAIEPLNYSLRKILKNRGAFPSDEAIYKVLYLGLGNVAKKWTRPIQKWTRHSIILLFCSATEWQFAEEVARKN